MFDRLRKIDPIWLVLATAFVVIFVNSGSRMVFGVTLKPMQEDLGWGRGALSSVQTTYMIVSAAIMPLAGRLADKYGFRLIIAAFVLIMAAGAGLTGFVQMPWQLFLLYGVVFAVGSGGSNLGVVIVLVSRWFTGSPGKANSTAIAGGAIGQLIIISIVATFLLDWGWRPSYKIVGLIIPALSVPMVLAFIRTRPPMPGASESREGTSAPKREREASQVGKSYKEVITSRKFLTMIFMFSICGFQDFLVSTHIVAFATDEGISDVLAGNLLAIMGVMGMLGVLFSGYLSDRFGPGKPSGLCFLIRIVAFSLVVTSNSPAAVIIFGLMYGFTFLMTAPLAPIYLTRGFGMRNLGALTGTANMVHQMSGGLGAVVAGVMFDAYGNYHGTWILALALSAIGYFAVVAIRDRDPLAVLCPCCGTYLREPHVAAGSMDRA